jgi:hypothetical protein
VDVWNMKDLQTTSTARSNMRLQTWAAYLSQYKDRIDIHHAKGASDEMACPDALSRLKGQIQTRHVEAKEAAMRYKQELDEELGISPCFLVTVNEVQPMVQEAVSEHPEEAEAGTISLSDEMKRKIVEGYSQNTHVLRLVEAMRDTEPDESEYRTHPSKPHFVMDKDGVLYFIDPSSTRKRIVLPTSKTQRTILHLAHDLQAHHGFLRTFRRISAGFFWRGMVKTVKAYICHCPQCLRNNPLRHAPYAKIRAIESPPEPFHTVTVDLITDLPVQQTTNGEVDSILTVTCKFSKAVKLVAGRKGEGAAVWADRYYKKVVNGAQGWGYPKVMISDRDKRFMAAMWQDLLKLAGGSSIFTTAWHPAGDGQSERTNMTVEIALRFFVDANQSGWLQSLPVVESALNNAESFATSFAPNEILFGRKPSTALDLAAADSSMSAGVIATADLREAIRKEAEDAIQAARAEMVHQGNRRRSEPDFSSGWAFICLGKGYTLPATVKHKIGAQRMGPFRIIEPVGRGAALRLDLPPNIGAHNVISCIHLEPAPVPSTDPFNRDHPEPGPITTDAGDEWEIERILSGRKTRKGGGIEYLVRWLGWGPQYDQWLNINELGAAQDLVHEYRQNNPVDQEPATERFSTKRAVPKRAAPKDVAPDPAGSVRTTTRSTRTSRAGAADSASSG